MHNTLVHNNNNKKKKKKKKKKKPTYLPNFSKQGRERANRNNFKCGPSVLSHGLVLLHT